MTDDKGMKIAIVVAMIYRHFAFAAAAAAAVVVGKVKIFLVIKIGNFAKVALRKMIQPKAIHNERQRRCKQH